MAEQPEINLWVAVLTTAIDDLSDPVERGGALEWLKAPGAEVGSFRWVADWLDMDAKRLRERILAHDRVRRHQSRQQQRAPKRWRAWGLPAVAA